MEIQKWLDSLEKTPYDPVEIPEDSFVSILIGDFRKIEKVGKYFIASGINYIAAGIFDFSEYSDRKIFKNVVFLENGDIFLETFFISDSEVWKISKYNGFPMCFVYFEDFRHRDPHYPPGISFFATIRYEERLKRVFSGNTLFNGVIF